MYHQMFTKRTVHNKYFKFTTGKKKKATEEKPNSPEVLAMSGSMLAMVVHVGRDAVILHVPAAEAVGPWLVARHLLLPLPGDGWLQRHPLEAAERVNRWIVDHTERWDVSHASDLQGELVGCIFQQGCQPVNLQHTSQGRQMVRDRFWAAL